MHTYEQATGRWSWNGVLMWVGFSGHGTGLNNPAFEQVHMVGPIVRGGFTIGPPTDDAKLGKFIMPLIPKPGTNTFGRSGFFLHGDEADDYDESASLGCVVKSPEAERIRVWATGDRDLTVV
jgi:type VI secretion system (T6SS) effector TldE1-like protein